MATELKEWWYVKSCEKGVYHLVHPHTCWSTSMQIYEPYGLRPGAVVVKEEDLTWPPSE